MLNRFKNALYGSSSANDDSAIIRVDYVHRDAVAWSNKLIRGALTRSSSFREDLLSDRRQRNEFGNNNNDNNSSCVYRSKGQIFNSSPITDSIEARYSVRDKSSNDPRQQIGDRLASAAKLPKFRYSRPDFLQLKTDDEILVSADHQIRPIILPRDVSRLPWKSGYAECINAGKSIRNEDQASCYQDVIVKKMSTLQSNHTDSSDPVSIENTIPWLYFGIFDGHAGNAVAVAAAAQLHYIIAEKLTQVADLLICLEFDMVDDHGSGEHLDSKTQDETVAPEISHEQEQSESVDDTQIACAQVDEELYWTNNKSTVKRSSNDDRVETFSDTQENLCAQPEKFDQSNDYPQQNQNGMAQGQENRAGASRPWIFRERRLPSMIDICRNNITVESLITGALESAFWEMDSLIELDKNDFRMPGGCTAIVSLFILGKLYVCNAGDSRAIVYKRDEVIPMSFDFTPTSERERILRLGLQRPEFLGDDFSHLEFLRRPTRRDVGKQMLYRDAFMTGWSLKTITIDDLKFPLVWGEGKRSRVLATIGVTRGFGDHELRALYGSLPIKPFLTPEPEVRVLPLESDDTLTLEDVLIIGTDGLWDVTTNQEAANIVKNSFDLFPDNEESRAKYRYLTAAQDLVIHSRGNTTNMNNVWRTNDDRLASLDDIAVFVIPLKQYRDDYLEWKKLRMQAKLSNLNRDNPEQSRQTNRETDGEWSE